MSVSFSLPKSKINCVSSESLSTSEDSCQLNSVTSVSAVHPSGGPISEKSVGGSLISCTLKGKVVVSEYMPSVTVIRAVSKPLHSASGVNT